MPWHFTSFEKLNSLSRERHSLLLKKKSASLGGKSRAVRKQYTQTLES